MQRLSLQTSILRFIARRPHLGRYHCQNESLEHALDQLKMMYPNFLRQIRGKTVVDFGCGEGLQAMAIAAAGAAHVVGVDKNLLLLEKSREHAQKIGICNVTFCDHLDADTMGTLDCVLSHNSMEHFSEPLEMLQLFKQLIHADGEIYITFGPPWYSPYGAHTQFFCKIPWIHLLFSEKAVLSVRNNYTDDVATCYEDVRGGLNRMSLAKFQQLLATLDCKIVYRKYIYMLNWHFLQQIPLLRELFLYHINVIIKS